MITSLIKKIFFLFVFVVTNYLTGYCHDAGYIGISIGMPIKYDLSKSDQDFKTSSNDIPGYQIFIHASLLFIGLEYGIENYKLNIEQKENPQFDIDVEININDLSLFFPIILSNDYFVIVSIGQGSGTAKINCTSALCSSNEDIFQDIDVKQNLLKLKIPISNFSIGIGYHQLQGGGRLAYKDSTYQDLYLDSDLYSLSLDYWF
ncbi:hypothetical protein KKA14_22320 [bacterium]|nr:hypothetical protein [bacterium]